MGRRGAVVRGVLLGWRVDEGVGSGRDAGQGYLEQPAHVGRQGGGGDRGGTQTVMTRRPGRDGQGYVMTRCRRGGTQAAMPRCTLRGGKSALTRHLWVPGAGPVVVHRSLRGGGSLMTRCAQGGTQTVLTRRPGRNGEGYVSTRCP